MRHVFLFLSVLTLPALVAGETGYDAWLRYAPIDAVVRTRYDALPAHAVALGDSLVIKTAQAELIRHGGVSSSCALSGGVTVVRRARARGGGGARRRARAQRRRGRGRGARARGRARAGGRRGGRARRARRARARARAAGRRRQAATRRRRRQGSHGGGQRRA